MRTAEEFIFDGQHSGDYRVRLVTTSKGLYNEPFLPKRTVVDKKIAGNERPYFQRVEQSPLSFPVTILLEGWLDNNNDMHLRELARWLFQDYYKPLIFESNPEKIFYAIFEGDSDLIHNGAKEGYIELNVLCDSPYTYTPEQELANLQFKQSDNTELINDSDTSFDSGIYSGTERTTNGVTVTQSLGTWGALYSVNQTWGELYND